MAERLLSVSAFARFVGGNKSTVQRMVADGRITKRRDGKINAATGLAEYRAAMAEKVNGGQPTHTGDTKADLLRAQLRERLAKAEARELELRREREELVDVAEVRADALKAAEVIRTGLLALPSRVALQVEALIAKDPGTRAARIEALIQDEVNEVLVVLNRTRFGVTP